MVEMVGGAGQGRIGTISCVKSLLEAKLRCLVLGEAGPWDFARDFIRSAWEWTFSV